MSEIIQAPAIAKIVGCDKNKVRYNMKVMSHSLKDLQKQQTSYGANYRNFRKKKELKAEFLTWRQKLFPVLRLMVLDI